jgi:hypothetical protein
MPSVLTTEYQQWKNTVLRHFLNHSGDAAGARLLDASLADNVPRCRFPSQFPEDHHDAAACRRPLVPAIEAFLPNYHLLYVQGSVDINPHEPVGGFQKSSRALALSACSSRLFISTRRVESEAVALCFCGM